MKKKIEKNMERVMMNPEWAARLLADNPSNRNVSRNTVAAMARDMEHGSFRLNGDAIRVGKDGQLYDGQHRLTACIRANTEFETYLITGLDEDDRLTIDRGRPRSVGDNLMLAYGVSSGKLVAATLRNMVIFAQQDLGAKPTASELKQLLDLHPSVPDVAVQMVNVQPGRPAVLAAIHYIASQYQGEGEKADQFVKVFKTGIPFYGEGDPAHVLRELLLKEKQRGIRGTDLRHYALFATAWEKFVTGSLVHSLRPKADFKLSGWDVDALYRREPEQKKAA